MVHRAARRDVSLLHGFEQSCLRLGRRTVDLIRKDDIGKDRTFLKLELPLLVQYLRTRDIAGHQVGCELYALEGEVEHICNGLYQQCLGEPGHTHEQRMPIAKDRDDEIVHHFVLPDNHLRYGRADLIDFFSQGFGSS